MYGAGLLPVRRDSLPLATRKVYSDFNTVFLALLLLHALILILFYLHTSGLGYPGLIVFQQTKAFHLQKQAAGNPTPAASSRRGKNTVLKSL